MLRRPVTREGELPRLSLDCRKVSHDAVAVGTGFVDRKVAATGKKSGRWQGLRESRRCSAPVDLPVGVTVGSCGGCDCFRWRWRECAIQIELYKYWWRVAMGSFVA